IRFPRARRYISGSYVKLSLQSFLDDHSSTLNYSRSRIKGYFESDKALDLPNRSVSMPSFRFIFANDKLARLVEAKMTDGVG
ncbi:unnamed protein product, partial [Mycena citricolor]